MYMNVCTLYAHALCAHVYMYVVYMYNICCKWLGNEVSPLIFLVPELVYIQVHVNANICASLVTLSVYMYSYIDM